MNNYRFLFKLNFQENCKLRAIIKVIKCAHTSGQQVEAMCMTAIFLFSTIITRYSLPNLSQSSGSIDEYFRIDR